MGMTVVSANTVEPKRLEILRTDLVSVRQQATVAHQIRQVTREAERLVLGRDKAVLLVRLERESWCVAECLDHLTHTTRAFLPTISKAIAGAPKLKTNRRLRTGLLPSLFIWNLNPPYRIRFKVLPQLAPPNPNSGTAWASFLESQSELLAVLSSTAGLAIDKVKIKSPVYASISYNIYGAFRMLAAHQSRHVWQISEILKALDNRPALGTA